MKISPATVIPGHQHARLTRFVDDLPENVLCEVDPVTNICRVNARAYEHLPARQQKLVYRAERTIMIEPMRPSNDDTAFAAAL